MNSKSLALSVVLIIFIAFFSWMDPSIRGYHCILSPSRLNASDRKTGAHTLYTPRPADYRNAFEIDKANSAKQSWDEYYGWVQVFYKGNLLSKGWDNGAKRLVAKLKAEEKREEVTQRLNELGRRISQEWSKDNSIRRIDTQIFRSSATDWIRRLRTTMEPGQLLTTRFPKSRKR